LTNAEGVLHVFCTAPEVLPRGERRGSWRDLPVAAERLETERALLAPSVAAGQQRECALAKENRAIVHHGATGRVALM